jgi:hypothetical protein
MRWALPVSGSGGGRTSNCAAAEHTYPHAAEGAAVRGLLTCSDSGCRVVLCRTGVTVYGMLVIRNPARWVVPLFPLGLEGAPGPPIHTRPSGGAAAALGVHGGKAAAFGADAQAAVPLLHADGQNGVVSLSALPPRTEGLGAPGERP